MADFYYHEYVMTDGQILKIALDRPSDLITINCNILTAVIFPSTELFQRQAGEVADRFLERTNNALQEWT